jgi:hypothetical protein
MLKNLRMITIECPKSKKESCDCCGGTTTRLTRFVYRDGDAFAIYYAVFSEEHPERIIEAVVSLGEWGEDSEPSERRAFALSLRVSESQYEVMVVNAEESPWYGIEFIGPMLDRDDALMHPWIEDVFHITDHIFTDDLEIKAYLDNEITIN